MPRSNKKKASPKSPQKQPLNETSQISILFNEEKNVMISRAISSGRKHGVNIQHGSSNPGLGDCAFESVIVNNNNRQCFKEKYPLSISYYRRIWAADMASRTVDTDWNILSKQEWMKGWEEMMIPGTYERGIFGDLMLPGIACGIRKFLLIFNTDPGSPHDPIFVVDPRQFNVQVDTAVPIILAYNQVHYESMHPCSNKDIHTSINLVKDYLEGRYKFDKKDLPFLLSLEDGGHSEPQVQETAPASSLRTQLEENKHEQDNEETIVAPSPKKISKYSQTSQHKKEGTKANCEAKRTTKREILSNDDDDFQETTRRKTGKESVHRNSSESQADKKINNHDKEKQDSLQKRESDLYKNIYINIEKKDDLPDESNNKDKPGKHLDKEKLSADKLCYKLKNTKKEHPIRQVNGMMECPSCAALVKMSSYILQETLNVQTKLIQPTFNLFLQNSRRKKRRDRQDKQNVITGNCFTGLYKLTLLSRLFHFPYMKRVL